MFSFYYLFSGIASEGKGDLRRNSTLGKFACDQCEKVVATAKGLRNHKINKHSGITYSCDECSFTTSIKKNVQGGGMKVLS